ncbi:hypothetical protein ES705_09464 [subsurface metagenome]
MNRNRKMTKLTTDFILAFSEKLRILKKNRDYEEQYITSTMLSGIYNVLINEGYSKAYLDGFFFDDDHPNIHKEWTEQAYKFRYSSNWPEPIRNRKNSSKIIEGFFNEDPSGIKLRKEIDKLSEKFDQ